MKEITFPRRAKALAIGLFPGRDDVDLLKFDA